MIKKKQTLSHVILLFLSPPLFLVFYDIVFTFTPIYLGDANLPVAIVVYMAFLDVYFLISLVWFYVIAKKQQKQLLPVFYLSKGLNKFMYALLVFISLFLFMLLVKHVFGNYNVTNVLYNNQTFYTESRRGSSWVYYFLNSFVFIALYDIYLNGFTKTRVFSFFCLVLVNAAAGSRGNIITYFFCFLLIYGVIWNGKRIFSAGLFILAFVLTTFVYNTLSRSGSENVGDYIGSSSSLADFNQANAINDSVKYWNEKGGCYTCFVQDLSTLFIPRYLYPDKPMSNAETREVYPKVAERGSTWTFGLYGSSIINMGLFAFIFIPVFYFYYSYLYFKSLTSRKKTFSRFSMIYLGANAVQFVRGGVIDVRLVRLFITLIIVYTFYVLMIEVTNKMNFKAIIIRLSKKRRKFYGSRH